MRSKGLPWWLGRQRILSAMQETWVHSLGQEDPLEKKMATHPSILAWRILWTEEPRLQSMVKVHGLAKSQTRLSDQHFNFHIRSKCSVFGPEKDTYLTEDQRQPRNISPSIIQQNAKDSKFPK